MLQIQVWKIQAQLRQAETKVGATGERPATKVVAVEELDPDKVVQIGLVTSADKNHLPTQFKPQERMNVTHPNNLLQPGQVLSQYQTCPFATIAHFLITLLRSVAEEERT